MVYELERSFRLTHHHASTPHYLHPPEHVVPQVFCYLKNKGNILASHVGLGFSHIWTNTRQRETQSTVHFGGYTSKHCITLGYKWKAVRIGFVQVRIYSMKEEREE